MTDMERESLIEQWYSHAMSVAIRNYHLRTTGWDCDDIRSCAREHLVRAIDNWDSSLGVSIQWYVGRIVQWGISNENRHLHSYRHNGTRHWPHHFRDEEYDLARSVARTSTKDNTYDYNMLESIVKEVDRRYRGVLHMYFFQHLTFSDIAFVINCSDTTAANWLRKGIKEIQNRLRRVDVVGGSA